MKKLFAIVLVLALVCCFVGCGKANESAGNSAEASSNGSSTDTPTKPVKSKIIVQLSGEPSSLDSQADSSVANSIVSNNIYSTLVTSDNDGNIIGAISDSWEYNEDFTEYTFHIRENAKFSDGSAITAEDVVFSMNRGIELGFNSNYAKLSKVEAVSADAVKFTLTGTNSIFLNDLAQFVFPIYSKAYVESGVNIAEEAAVTSGAYYLAEWNAKSNLLLKANPYYWNDLSITEVDMQIIPDANTALIALESGEVDYIIGSGFLTASEIETVNSLGNAQLIASKKATYMFLSLNFQYEPLADVNVRHAIDCAIDRNNIIAAVGGLGEPVGSIPLRAGMGGYLPGYEAVACDMDKAKEYMAQSAYPDGFELDMLAVGGNYTKCCESLQSQLAPLGIKVNVVETDPGSGVSKMTTGDYQACIMSWSNTTGDISQLAPMYMSGSSMLFNQDLDNAYGMGIATSTSYMGADRDALLKQSYDAMMDTVPYIGLYFADNFYACSANLDYGIMNSTRQMIFASMQWLA